MPGPSGQAVAAELDKEQVAAVLELCGPVPRYGGVRPSGECWWAQGCDSIDSVDAAAGVILRCPVMLMHRTR